MQRLRSSMNHYRSNDSFLRPFRLRDQCLQSRLANYSLLFDLLLFLGGLLHGGRTATAATTTAPAGRRGRAHGVSAIPAGGVAADGRATVSTIACVSAVPTRSVARDRGAAISTDTGAASATTPLRITTRGKPAPLRRNWESAVWR